VKGWLEDLSLWGQRDFVEEDHPSRNGAAGNLGLTRQGLLNKIARYNIQV
jgi:hypothetical protein